MNRPVGWPGTDSGHPPSGTSVAQLACFARVVTNSCRPNGIRVSQRLPRAWRTLSCPAALATARACRDTTAALREARRSSPAQDPVAALTLEQQVGQLIVLSFSGTTAPAYVLDAVRRRRVAGVILFGGNIGRPGSCLSSRARCVRPEVGPSSLLIRKEGRCGGSPGRAGRPAAAQQATGTAGLAARNAAGALRHLGITVSLAPVADVPSVPGAAIAGRAFSSDPAETSRAVAAAVRGWRSGGIASTAKHFPGLGGATRNTDAASVTIRRSRARLGATDLPPFEAAVRRACRCDGRPRSLPGARPRTSRRSRARSSSASSADSLASAES